MIKIKEIFKRSKIKYSNLPQEVQNMLFQNYLLYGIYIILFLSIIIVTKDINILKFGLLFLLCMLIYLIHLSYIFFYSKVRFVEGIVKDKELSKFGSYIYLQNGNIYYKIRVRKIIKFRISSYMRFYYVPSVVIQKDEDLYVINGSILNKTIKNNFLENKR